MERSCAASVYTEFYLPSRASVFPCYYVFTAAIMHVATCKSFALSSFRCGS